MDREKPPQNGSTQIVMYLEEALWTDNVDQFVSLVEDIILDSNLSEGIKFVAHPPQILETLVRTASIKCAAALINGDTGQTVDLNVPSTMGVYPLHFAALRAPPDFVELYLFHGAETNHRYRRQEPDYLLKLPLNLAVESICDSSPMKEWNPKLSIFKLVFIYGLPFWQDHLEKIELLAHKTSGTKEEILQYARDGKVAEFASLLIVARKMFTNFVTTVGECVSEQIRTLTQHRECGLLDIIVDNNNPLAMIGKIEALMSIQQLLHVWERAGDAIEAYIREDKTHVSNCHAIEHVQTLLQEAGFILKPEDYLSDEKWFREWQQVYNDRPYKTAVPLDWRATPADLGMQHYSWSGLRWPCKATSNGMVRSFHTLRVLSKASSGIKYPSAVQAEVKNTMKRVELYLPNLSRSKPWELFASVIKRGLKCI